MSAAKWSVFSFLCGWIVSIWLLSAMFPAAAADMFCNQCRKQIRPGQGYLMSHGKVYYSRKCYIRTLPECTICRRRSFNGGIYAMDHSFFACPDCMKLPRCFSCQIPVRDGAQLSGGRVSIDSIITITLKTGEKFPGIAPVIIKNTLYL